MAAELNNKFLRELDEVIPVGNYKMQQVFLFTLIDAYLSLEVSNEEFLYSIKSILTEE
jgi:hypothetical protein